MDRSIENKSLRKVVGSVIIATTSFFLLAAGYITKSNNEESLMRAGSSILNIASEASLDLEKDFEPILKGLLTSEQKTRNFRLNILLNSAHYSDSNSDIFLSLRESNLKGFIKKQNKEGRPLSEGEISILSKIDSKELTNKSILAKISGKIYVIRKETVKDTSNQKITFILGKDISDTVISTKGIEGVVFRVSNDKYLRGNRSSLISKIATENGVSSVQLKNEKWISSQTIYDVIVLAVIYYLSIFIMFYLYRIHTHSAFKSPMKHLLMVISSSAYPKEIDCPEAFGSLSKVVKGINKAIKELLESNAFEKEAINVTQMAIVITDKTNKILYVNTQFVKIFPLKNIIGSELTALLNTCKRNYKNLKENNSIEIKNLNGSKSLYQISSTVIKNDKYEHAALGHTVHEFKNVDEIIELKKKLEARFKIDELTSLHTRCHFNDIANEIILNSTEEETNFLALIDINDFKILNDSAGHEIGDLILMELATLLREHTDEDDILGRMSGDEFVILFKNKSLEYTESKLCELYTAIKNYKILHFDTKIGVTSSIGLTNASKTANYTDVRVLLQQADLAVMTAKKSGFMFKLYDHNDSDIMFYREAPQWINRIKNSIAHNTFELFVQEITPFSDDNPQHLEVLLRMKDEKGGYYAPFKFFDVAEKFNLMKQIDEWVVVNTFKKIMSGIFDNGKVSINLSAETIKDINAVEKIIYYANSYKLNASKVVFEITETMAIYDLNAAIININTLRFRGFSIALDDFGSGFSTFKYIQNIPADYIKIDGIFVKNATKCNRDRAIVANIVSIAHELGMHCVAEFVENEDTMRLMEDLGVDYIQGYHVHKPCPTSEWVRSKTNSFKKIA
jgi:diguanylate cyclase (GGDEF)-like protein